MPSPFPGMDPYLESPELWPDLHHEMISVIRESLNVSLRPRYHAMVEERVYVSDDRDPGRKVIIPVWFTFRDIELIRKAFCGRFG